MYLAFFFFFLMALSYIPIDYGFTNQQNTLLQNTLIRMSAGIAFCFLLYSIEWKIFKKPSKKDILFILPALFVVLNNFPLSAYIKNTAIMTEPTNTIYIFVLDAISTGFLEELIFRFIIFNAILKSKKIHNNTIKAIIVSSIIFSLMHGLNIISGMPVNQVITQIGYSFLIGLLFASVYVLTNNIVYSMILHAIYNITGLFFVTLGTMYNRYDLITIISTILIGFIAFVLYLYWIVNLSIDKTIDYQ